MKKDKLPDVFNQPSNSAEKDARDKLMIFNAVDTKRLWRQTIAAAQGHQLKVF